jgi:hypothetical protein
MTSFIYPSLKVTRDKSRSWKNLNVYPFKLPLVLRPILKKQPDLVFWDCILRGPLAHLTHATTRQRWIRAPDQRQPISLRTSASASVCAFGCRPVSRIGQDLRRVLLAMVDDVGKKVAGLIVVGDSWFAMCCAVSNWSLFSKKLSRNPHRP